MNKTFKFLTISCLLSALCYPALAAPTLTYQGELNGENGPLLPVIP